MLRFWSSLSRNTIRLVVSRYEMTRKENTDAISKDRKRVVLIEAGPSITETGAVARSVTLADGSFQTQTYVEGRGWRPDIVSAYSVMIAFEGAREDNLAAMGYSREQIAEILERPEPQTDPR